MAMFLGQFKKYQFTHAQVIKLSIQSGGMLAAKVSNLNGIFSQMLRLGVGAKQTRTLLCEIPEFVLQNRGDLLRLKIDIIERESGRDHIYMRNFVRRHPDIVMK